ncbi:MAG: hypothetical protein ACRC8Y_05295 [Chroococcales cyanobacterium]
MAEPLTPGSFPSVNPGSKEDRNMLNYAGLTLDQSLAGTQLQLIS